MVFPSRTAFHHGFMEIFWNSGLRILQSGLVFSGKLSSIIGELTYGKVNLQSISQKLREAFEELGATYIKLGQFIASTPSLFPPELTNEMQKCLDQVRPVPIRDIYNIIQEELGEHPKNLFQSFEEIPIASASIAQVHAAVTKDGLDVVVKVQRPDIETILETDMAIIQTIGWILEKISPTFRTSGLLGMIDEFRKSILEETNFIQEAANIEEFDNYLLRLGETRAVVPRVYHSYSSRRVLTMERLYGAPITDLESLHKYTPDPRALLETALEIWFSGLADSGFFHADVHAGNLMVLTNGKIGFIDFGIIGRIPPKTWISLLQFMEGMALGDAESVAQGLIGMDSTAKGIDEKKLIQDLDLVFQKMHKLILNLEKGEFQSEDERELNQILFELKKISEENGLKIPREFGLLIKQLLYFDRYVRILAPDIHLIRDQKKFLAK